MLNASIYGWGVVVCIYKSMLINNVNLILGC